MYNIETALFYLDFTKIEKKEVKRLGLSFLEKMPTRVEELRTLWREQNHNNVSHLDFSRKSIQDLSQWFFSTVHSRKRSKEEIAAIRAQVGEHIPISPEEPDERTLSLCIDVGYYFGQTLQHNFPHLQWQQDLSSKRSISYGRLVLIPFSFGQLDPILICRTYAYGIIAKSQHPDRLLELFDIWSSKIILS